MNSGSLNTSAIDNSGFLLNTTPDKKIEYLRTASEKSKTQTILQKRPEHTLYIARGGPETSSDQQNTKTGDNSDDDIKIVEIVKKETSPDHNSGRSIEDVVENVINSQKEIGGKLASALSNSKIVINNQFINYVVPPSSQSGAMPGSAEIQSRVQTSIRVNPKYQSPQKIIRVSPPPQPASNITDDEMSKGEKQLEMLIRENENALLREASLENELAKLRGKMSPANKRGNQITTENEIDNLEQNLSKTIASLRDHMDQNKNCETQLEILLRENDVARKKEKNLDESLELLRKQTQTEKDVQLEQKKENNKSTIRLNPKYTNLVGGKKPEECGNIADTDSLVAEPPEQIVRPNTGPRLITINPKYAERRTPVISSTPRPPSASVSSASVSSSSPSLASLLRADSQSQEASRSIVTQPHLPVTPTSYSSSSSILNNMLAAPPQQVYVPQAYKSSQISPLASSLPSNKLKRKHPEAPSRLSGPLCKAANLVNEPLPGLWKFFVAVLHNPNYNPKLIAWEHLEQGAFRIRYLKDLFELWIKMRGSVMNYDLFSKTVKLYDEKGFLHSVEGMRCVYRFGQNALGWKPEPHEITGDEIVTF